MEFIAKCNRFMTAWCTKAMGGEGSSDNTKIIGENNLLTECMFNMQVDEMKGFTLEWVRIFWNRFGEVIRDPVLGPSSSTALAQFLDRNQPNHKRHAQQHHFRSLQRDLLVHCARTYFPGGHNDVTSQW